ncbi:MAG: lysophospholipid acyltransferase family protein [Caldilineaceae bacterium]|nr:lysophospholipid acyltransferase family protein [Caldilineaceae bacterium]
MRVLPKLTYASPDDPLAKQLLIRSVERLSGRRRLERIYDTVLAQEAEQSRLWGAALRALRIHVDYDAKQLAQVPTEGPIILVANHPYGLLDGLIVCHFASLLRPAFKILIHKSLCREPRVERYLLPIDFAETTEAAHTNIDSKRRAMTTLQEGNAVVIFPAGGIATTVHGPFGKAVDLEWKLFVAKLIQMTEATVIPIYFHGQNSRIFQLASHLSLTLRLALIIHEVNRKAGETIRVSIGDPIFYQNLAKIRKRKELLYHLRDTIYALDPTKIAHYPPPQLPFDKKKVAQGGAQ